MSGSDSPITFGRHNDFVGSDASKGRIPGADKATTGHHFVAVDVPRDQQRQKEHLQPSTGRDAQPSHAQGLQSDILNARAAAGREPSPVRRINGEPQPLSPAPDSRTVIDKDPYATPTAVGDTLTGATSKDVHDHIGHPGSGMSSAEMHHDGSSHRKRQLRGTEQFGSGEVPREIGTEAEQPGELYKS
ncbi:hypothetical protein C8Q70DRAFT_1114031 [Cubamyces menziesii]|uniref:Uncharacterized protein n=1 Tax=Trametes cubensis TaxID=1111947 RepID=A0AAD7XDL6_9APHY|nr:hypothetical protein C8Q70DRAFT_1114031 [Cubamyces menziesii]KAJ8488828.1 hypothetical protein ONZ51_g3293 [Trametes cubensis]